ncbi:MAG TPA: DedA family protein [Herpetosiphonaceae bacterium]
MTLNDYVLIGLVQYGLPVLFGVVLLASLGAPLPATLLLLTAGAFVADGDLSMWWVFGLGTVAAVLGDHLGYSIGRWGSQRLIDRLSRWGGGASRIEQAEAAARRWGGIGIFLSRWLLTPIGPVINLTSGIARYSLPAFFCFDIAGEMVWVGSYVTLGRVFSDQVQDLSGVLGNLTWVIVGIVTMALLAWMLLRQKPVPEPEPAPALTPIARPGEEM